MPRRSPSSSRPPALARLILRLALPEIVRDGFAGDLEERFHAEAEHDLAAARRRYWKDVLSPTLLHLRREAKGQPLPPGASPGTGRGDGRMTALLTDLKFALRMIRKAPGFTAVAVLSLALGIGPNTAIFSLVDSVLFQDWGVRDADTLMDIYSRGQNGDFYFTNWRTYELVSEGAGDAFDQVAGHAFYVGNVDTGGESELVMGEMVTGNYFDVMGVGAERGRTFLPEEDATPGTHPVVVLSDRYWRGRLGADPSTVGSQIRLNGRPYTVVGIAPASFKGRLAPGIGTDFWVPMSMWTHLTPDQKGQGNFMITGRMKSGVTKPQAEAAVDAVAARYNDEHPDSRRKMQLGGVILGDILLSPGLDQTIGAMAALLFAAVGMVLLIACVNLAGFLLARATDRRKEMAVRIAMGAGAPAIARQLLVEAFVLAGLGGALGLVLGQVFLRSLLAVRLPVPFPLQLHVVLDAKLFVFTAGVTVAAALVFGLTPALQAIGTPVASTLRDEAGGSGGRKKARARQILVAAQMAVCTVLIFGSGVFVNNLRGAAKQDVGFSTAPAAVVTAETWAGEYSVEQKRDFVEAVIRDVTSQPGVDVVAATERMPLDLGTTNTALDIPGVDPPSDANHWVIEVTDVSPNYFAAMDIPILAGRSFNDADNAEAQSVLIISRAMAQRFWSDPADAVGQVVHAAYDPDTDYVVAGVAGDVKIWSLTEAPRMYVYKPIAQSDGGFGTYNFVARGPVQAPELAARIRDTIKRIDPDMVVSDVGTMATHLGYIFFLPRMAALLLTLVGTLALTLGAVGLYGMVGYAAARRSREMGIRLALGAERGRVVGMVVRGGLAVVAFGAVAGLAASLGLGTLLSRFVIGGNGLDPVSLLAAPVVLGLVAFLAAYVPARRVGRIDPTEALRSE